MATCMCRTPYLARSASSPGALTQTSTLTGLDDPDALAFDSFGDLFVANGGNGTVSEFAIPPATLTITGKPGDNIEVEFTDATNFTLIENGAVHIVLHGTGQQDCLQRAERG